MAKTSEIIEIYDKIVRDENNEPIYCMTTIFNKQVNLTGIIVMPVVILQSKYYKIYYPIFYKYYTDFNLDILNSIRFDGPSMKNLPPHISTKHITNVNKSKIDNVICLNSIDGKICAYINKSFDETPNNISYCQMEIEYSNLDDKDAYIFIVQNDMIENKDFLCTVVTNKCYDVTYIFETTARMEYIDNVIALNEDIP